MTNKSPIKFKFGSEQTFNSINKDENTVYFITDDYGNHRLYVGNDCYNVSVVTSLSGAVSDKTVPSTSAVLTELNKKVDHCSVVVSDDSTLPQTLLLQNNTEYRFLNLTGATELTISIPTSSIASGGGLFYSSVILHTVNSANDVATFVQTTPDSPSVVFLNPAASMSEGDTVELLFFSNGLDICCIAAPSNHPTT